MKREGFVYFQAMLNALPNISKQSSEEIAGILSEACLILMSFISWEKRS
jgi:hypothetical protein